MSTLIGATEAARALGVTKPTLYAYVSRGTLSRQVAVDGRTSLYNQNEIDALAQRSRRRTPTDRPSIDVQIATAITHLHDDSPTYRGHPVLDLARTHSYEQVAELLMTGQLPDRPITWVVDRAALDRARAVISAAAPVDPITALSLAASTLDGGAGGDAVGRGLLAIAPSLMGGPLRGDVATRLAKAWAGRPDPALTRAISCALILLADHELATSTLAVRVAASVRTAPSAAIATGLNVVAGPFHGAASRASSNLFDDATDRGAEAAISDHLVAGRRLPGFGHSVYRSGDPRFAPLLDAVRAVPAPPERLDVVDAVIAEAGRAIGHLPNVDLALGALFYVGGLPPSTPLFAVARIAGWVAHYDEEIGERPVRFRGLARAR